MHAILSKARVCRPRGAGIRVACVRVAVWLGAAFALSLVGCSGAGVSADPALENAGGAGGASVGGASTGGGAGALGSAGAAGGAPLPRQHTAGCTAPAGVSASPHTIADAVALINALPKPLTLTCYLQALARPLEMSATTSVFSAQPAQGRRSPRIFLFLDPDIVSVVPDGDGAALLELGEEQPDFRSLKGQITFPVLAPLTPTAPFEGLMYNDRLSTCGLCHASEQQDSGVSGIRAFISESLRPRQAELVSADELRQQLASCDRTVELGRCEILDGLLGWGSVTDRVFPDKMDTFGGGP